MADTIPLNHMFIDQRYTNLMADTKYNKDTLYEDPHFKACSDSIFLGADTFLVEFYNKRDSIKWLRPREILEGKQEPKFFKDGASFNEIMLPEGYDNLVNGNFMNALAAITLAPKVLNFVCPEQSFTENYKGIFRFRFWRFGKWNEVVIDDRLPTLDGKLLFSRSMSKDEFWVSLMEKALAKLLTKYEAMDSTFEVPEAFLDLSGGTVETVCLSATKEDVLRSKLKMFRKTGSLVTATLATGLADDCGLNKFNSLFIIPGKVQKVMQDNNGVMIPSNIVRVMNTARCEWTGPWGDKSKEMKSLSAEVKKEFGITSQIEGDFWMDIKDFLKRFEVLKVLHIPPELSEKDKTWNVTEHFNKWQKGTTAMGCFTKNKEDFYKNPQYKIKIDDDGDLVVASLMAVGKRREETSWDGNYLGLDVYKYEDGATIDSEFLKNNFPLHTFEHKRGLREVTLSMALDPGNYVIIPSTYEPGNELPFLLRFFCGYSSKTESANPKSVYTSKLPGDLELDFVMEPIIHSFFEEHAGKDELMDNTELDAFFKTLKENDLLPCDISQETSAAISALFDEDDSRKLCVDEVSNIGALVNYSKFMFRKADKDGSGCLDASELRDALFRAGLFASDAVLYHLVDRYVGSDNKVTFDEYLLMVSKLRYVIRQFQTLGGSNEKSVAMSAEDLLKICTKL
ncbi:calpain-A-like [Anneissia japonica]|uniref:calpain-A-like n=1 Tax=Anneissia japonica TaxID=1529436 RepID=UPI0014254FBE|nr:calpain-A-like [Anneissia japonica]